MSGWCWGGERTACFLKAGRRARSAAVDLLNRAAADAVFRGCSLLAVRPVLFGGWSQGARAAFLDEADKWCARMKVVRLPDSFERFGTLDAGLVVYAQRGRHPFTDAVAGDALVAAADVRRVSHESLDAGELRPSPPWGDILLAARAGKYPTRPLVVRFAAAVDDFSAVELRRALRGRLRGLRAVLSGSKLRELEGMTGMIVACGPRFARRLMRRLHHLNRRATTSLVGRLAPLTPAPPLGEGGPQDGQQDMQSAG